MEKDLKNIDTATSYLFKIYNFQIETLHFLTPTGAKLVQLITSRQTNSGRNDMADFMYR